MVPGKTTQLVSTARVQSMALPMSFIPLNLLVSSSFREVWGNAQSIDQMPRPLRRRSTNCLKEYLTYQDYLNLAARFIPAGKRVTTRKIEGKFLIPFSTATAFQTFTITRELQQDKGLLMPAEARQTPAPLPNLS